MSCGCAKRMRGILHARGYKRDENGVWRKEGSEHAIPDDRVEEEHFKVLIETMVSETMSWRVNRLMNRTRGSRL